MPGSPKTSVRPRTPNATGFPGRTATRQKTSSTPSSASVVADEVVDADRDAAARDEDVGLEPALDRRPRRLARRRATGGSRSTVAPALRIWVGQDHAVRVVDLAGRERLARASAARSR